MARHFTGGSNERIQFPGGAAPNPCSFVGGPATWAAIIRPDSFGAIKGIYGAGGGSGQEHNLQVNASGQLRLVLSGTGSVGSTGMTAGKWYLVAAVKDVPTSSLPRLHIYDYLTNTWVHENGGTNLTAGSAPTSGITYVSGVRGGGNYYDGDIAVLGCYDVALTDAQIESLPFALTAWYAVQPKILWLLDQASVAQLACDLITGYTQNSITGTTVSTGSVPIWTPAAPIVVAESLGPPTYTDTPSGGVRLAGSTVVSQVHQLGARSGGIVLGVPVASNKVYDHLPSGGILLGGSAEVFLDVPPPPALPPWPTINVEVAFNLPPAQYAPGAYFQIGSSWFDGEQTLAPATNWTDLSDRVRQLSITRGRNYELDRVEAGTAHITFENRDSFLDPTNSDSPYWPQVKPMKRIRVTVEFAEVTYHLFNGFVESWPPIRRGTKDSEVTVECVDAFATLQQAQLADFYGFAFPGVRINQVLDEINWPTGDRLIEDGSSRVADADFTQNRTAALEHLQAVAESEAGYIFMDGNGKFCFHDRHHRRTDPDAVIPAAIFGNVPFTLPYTDIDPSYDAAHIYNDIALTVPDDPMPASAGDAASQEQYWKRSLERSTELYSWNEAQTQAAYLLQRYKDPYLRFDSLTIRPGPIGNLWAHALGREIGDRIQIQHQPTSGPDDPVPPLVQQDCFIEGINHEVAGLKWTTRWQLSTPTAVDAGAGLIIGHATQGQIGTTNVLVY